jgi:hypothetical protein
MMRAGEPNLVPVGYGEFIITDTVVTVRVTRANHKKEEHKFGTLSAALRFCDENVIETCKVDEVVVETTLVVKPDIKYVAVGVEVVAE